MTTADQKIVLIVDDIEDNRVLIERALRSSGHRLVSVDSGNAALSWMSSHKPDIVLLDWMMPGISGLDTLRAIREQHSPACLPVIMCTAVGEEELVVGALEAGANDYIIKPISIPILRARMRMHMTQSATVIALNEENGEVRRRITEQRKQFFQRQGNISL